MGSAPKRKLPTDMTTDEFFAWDGDGTGRKFQLFDGALRAMAPASATHGIIQANLARLLGNHIRGTGLPCVVATEPPVVPRVGADKNLRAPDVGLSCSKAADAARAFADPLLLAEILSPSNRSDTWLNVWAFATLPSVKEILVVDSMKRDAKLLTRGPDGSWPATPTALVSGQTLRLTCIDFELPLESLYEGTRLQA